MENWSIVGPKFSGEGQFSMKIFVRGTKIPKGDGKFTEVPRARPQLKEGLFDVCFLDVHLITRHQKFSGVAYRVTQEKELLSEANR